MQTLECESGLGTPRWSPGGLARLSVSGQRCDDENRATNCLAVAVNRSTGYGGLVWYVTERNANKGGIYDRVWISDNPSPVKFDPRIVADPGYPLFHDPASAIPLPLVRVAMEEFASGEGDRPECVAWVPGSMNGERNDRPSKVEYVEDPELDWGLMG
ncbi:Imm1 family immunity protein [Kitasatospora purpeofusca]|uniref:Imm1 family immunity protein n=1 Tax=Kitasatospora purpeofusca TaxID=67352 RepID=UPI0036614CEA